MKAHHENVPRSLLWQNYERGRLCDAQQGKRAAATRLVLSQIPLLSDVDFGIQIAHCSDANRALGCVCQTRFHFLGKARI